MKKLFALAFSIYAALIVLSGCSNQAGLAVYKKGIVTDAVYESEFIGLRYTLPDGYSMTPEKDLNNIEGVAGAMLEMEACSTKGSSQISILVEETTASEEEYIQSFIDDMADLPIPLIKSEIERETTEIAGQAYRRLNMKGGITYTGLYHSDMVRKIGNRMVIIMTSYDADDKKEFDTIMSGFSAY